MSFVEKGTYEYSYGMRMNAIRERLKSPPNAVKDEGIDLRRKRKEPSPPRKVIDLEPQVIVSLPLKINNDTISPGEIRFAACTYFDLPIDRFESDDRRYIVAYARHIAIYLTRTRTKKSWGEMKPFFGHRDHTTLLHGWKRISKMLMARKPGVLSDIRGVMEALNDYRRRFGIPTINEPPVALELQYQEGLPRPQICFMDETSAPSMAYPEAEGFPNHPG